MSGAARFGRYMSRPVIEGMAKDRGLAGRENAEKFLIDLEAFYHMRRAMPDCVVMGGMAAL